MTDTNNTDGAALLPVTQADRERAHPFIATDWRRGDQYSTGYYVLRGERDEHPLVQAFARHRQAHSLPGDAETLALVAGYADYKAISDDRWEQGKAAGYRELGQLVAAALSSPLPATQEDAERSGVDEAKKRTAINGILAGLLLPLVPDPKELIALVNQACTEILASLSTPTAEPMARDDAFEERIVSMFRFGSDDDRARAKEACGIARLRTLSDLHPLGQEYDGDALRGKCRLCSGRGGVTEEQGDGAYVGAECPVCGGHGFSEEIEDELWEVIMDAHGPDSNARHYAKATLLWLSRRALSATPAPTVNETARQDAKVWRVICWDDDGERCEFHFISRSEYDAFMAGKPKDVQVTDIHEAYQHTADYALAALSDRPQAEGEVNRG